MAREEFSNNVSGSLSAAITSSGQTTMAVNNQAAFPQTGQITVLIETEIIRVTGGLGTSTWTIARGQEGTTATTHVSGAIIYGTMTDGSLRRLGRQSVNGTEFSARRELNFSDNSRGWWKLTDDSTNDRVAVESHAKQHGEPNYSVVQIADWNAIDTSAKVGASILNITDGMYAHCPANNGDVNIHARNTAPSTPYSIIAKFRFNSLAVGSVAGGLMFREGTSGNFHRIAFNLGTGNIVVDRWTNNTTPTGSPDATFAVPVGSNLSWFKIRDDGTNKLFFVSTDGTNWIQVASVAHATFFTPNQVGFVFNGNTGTAGVDKSGMVVESYQVVNS